MKKYDEKSPGLSKAIINIVKPVYMELCELPLLNECFHGMTQNNNENFSCVLWQVLQKSIFIEIKTLQLRAYLAVLHFNKGMKSRIEILKLRE